MASLPSLDITDVRLLDTYTLSFDPNTLYIGSYQEIGDTGRLGPQAPLILCGSVPEGFAAAHLCLSIAPENELAQIFNAAKDYCLGDLVMKGELAKFLISSKSGYLADMVNETAKALGNPVIVMDISFNVLAYSDSFTSGDEWWNEFIQSGRFMPDLLKHSLAADASLEVEGNEPFLVTTCTLSETPKLSTRLTVDDKWVGSLVMRACCTPINPRHYRHLSVISPIISEAVASLSKFKHIGTVQEKLLGDILDAPDNNALSDACLALNNFANELPDRTALIVFQNAKGLPTRNRVSYLRFNLKELFPDSYVIYHEDHLTMLVPVDQDRVTLNDAQQTTLDSFIQAEQLLAGASHVFADIGQLPNAFQEGLRSLDHCSPASPFRNWHECVFAELVHEYARVHSTADLIHPALRLVETHDRLHGSELSKTLRVYLENDKNIERCTQLLHLHRSSVYYRLNRVKELAHLNIDDPEVSFQLLCSYRIQQYQSRRTTLT
ncbi:MAG: helix-turn-helix domain-containing protein [Propionibacteriaceae bacterium]|nr:helix-turn-helix domain-containing protein [Propionibacteriaceae bacterium]